MNWILIFLGFCLLIILHEAGHFVAAKATGMRVERFFLFFGPTIWSFKKGETEYAISAIPLGGYVKISGMIDESLDTEAMKQEPQPWEFRSKPAWQRLDGGSGCHLHRIFAIGIHHPNITARS